MGSNSNSTPPPQTHSTNPTRQPYLPTDRTPPPFRQTGVPLASFKPQLPPKAYHDPASYTIKQLKNELNKWFEQNEKYEAGLFNGEESVRCQDPERLQHVGDLAEEYLRRWKADQCFAFKGDLHFKTLALTKAHSSEYGHMLEVSKDWCVVAGESARSVHYAPRDSAELERVRKMIAREGYEGMFNFISRAQAERFLVGLPFVPNPISQRQQPSFKQPSTEHTLPAEKPEISDSLVLPGPAQVQCSPSRRSAAFYPRLTHPHCIGPLCPDPMRLGPLRSPSVWAAAPVQPFTSLSPFPSLLPLQSVRAAAPVPHSTSNPTHQVVV